MTQELLAEEFDCIFYTGGSAGAKFIARAAAEHFTPLTLELGGKSPCIVDADAKIDLAAKRIVWGKFLNAGQTCVAPDYLFVHAPLLEPFTAAFAHAVRRLLGDDPRQSRHYARLVSARAFDRVAAYLSEGRILAGGRTDAAERYIEPTLLGDVPADASVMREEIFGPVLPLFAFDRIDEAIDFIEERPRPLALYYFGPEKAGGEVLRRTTSGGACLNDTVMQIANGALPFGGVGDSGMGRYHGRDSFELFTHRRAVVSASVRLDPPFRYMPYRWFRWVRRIL